MTADRSKARHARFADLPRGQTNTGIDAPATVARLVSSNVSQEPKR